MFDSSRTRFHDNNVQKGARNFERAFSKVLDRVKSVALWSVKKKKKKRTIKGYGSAANTKIKLRHTHNKGYNYHGI